MEALLDKIEAVRADMYERSKEHAMKQSRCVARRVTLHQSIAEMNVSEYFNVHRPAPSPYAVAV